MQGKLGVDEATGSARVKKGMGMEGLVLGDERDWDK